MKFFVVFDTVSEKIVVLNLLNSPREIRRCVELLKEQELLSKRLDDFAAFYLELPDPQIFVTSAKGQDGHTMSAWRIDLDQADLKGVI